MITSWKKILFAGLLSSLAGTGSAAPTYTPNDLATFNSSNQCNNCDLSGATIKGNHSFAVFSGTNLTGSRVTGTFASTVFYNCNISSANWSGVNLSYGNLSYTPLVKTNFTNADLSYANFQGAITNDAVFDGANLLNANITQDQLKAAASYCNATLPDGTKQNC